MEDEFMKKARRIFEAAEEKYRKDHPCPKCGSHNVDFDITYICGPYSGWVEWCNDCGWKKVTDTHNKEEITAHPGVVIGDYVEVFDVTHVHEM